LLACELLQMRNELLVRPRRQHIRQFVTRYAKPVRYFAKVSLGRYGPMMRHTHDKTRCLTIRRIHRDSVQRCLTALRANIHPSDV
jgi:hypothetical protein